MIKNCPNKSSVIIVIIIIGPGSTSKIAVVIKYGATNEVVGIIVVIVDCLAWSSIVGVIVKV